MQENLQQRALGLRDSLILMEFLQNVRLEEMLNQKNQMQVRRRKRRKKEQGGRWFGFNVFVSKVENKTFGNLETNLFPYGFLWITGHVFGDIGQNPIGVYLRLA